MSFLKKAFFSASNLLPLPFLLKQSGVPLLLPYHHVVSDDALPHIQNLYAYKNRKAFTNDLDWLLKNFSTVHPGVVSKHFLSGEPLPSPSFLLSFDDGYREVYDVIAPIFEQKGVPALFFINPQFIDNKELFYRCKLSLVIEKLKSDNKLRQQISQHLQLQSQDAAELQKKILDINYNNKSIADELGKIASIDFDAYLEKQKPFLTSEQIKKLASRGFVFGAHSWDHPNYSLLSTDQQMDQTLRSLQFVRDLCGNSHEYFSFPHQDKVVAQDFFNRIKDSEKDLLLFGLQNQKAEDANHVLHRFNAEDPAKNIRQVTKGILFYNTTLSLIGRRIVRR